MKTVIRELFAMIVIVVAIALIVVLVFFDYIKEDANQPQSAIYETSKEEKKILEEKKKYEEDKQTITVSSGYQVDEIELSNLKAAGEFKQGQSSPFAETPVTDILYDKDGNVYYQTVDPTLNITNTNNNNLKNTTDNKVKNKVNNKTNNAVDNENKISDPSSDSGNIYVTQKGNGK